MATFELEKKSYMAVQGAYKSGPNLNESYNNGY